MQGLINSSKHARRVLSTCGVPLGLLLVACGGSENATTTPATETLSGTIVVHVTGGNHSSPQQGLEITRLGSKGEHVSSLETKEHTIHVAPGVFEVTVLGTPAEKGLTGAGQRVTIAAHQQVNVVIPLKPKSHPSARRRR